MSGLIQCPDCGRQISRDAKVCPQCGKPNRTPSEQVQHNMNEAGKGMMGCGCLAVILGFLALLLLGI